MLVDTDSGALSRKHFFNRLPNYFGHIVLGYQESQHKTEVWNERAPGVAPGHLSPRSSPRTSGAKTSSWLGIFVICRCSSNARGRLFHPSAVLRSHTPSTGRGLEFTQSLHSFVKQHLGRMLNCLVCLADLAKNLTACDNSNL